ncbi:MAG: hypothetical protein AAF654_02705 [Myxococcota bacterium]
MKNLAYALLAALIAMFATSGLVALATAAPTPEPTLTEAEEELVAHLDARLMDRLADVKRALNL